MVKWVIDLTLSAFRETHPIETINVWITTQWFGSLAHAVLLVTIRSDQVADQGDEIGKIRETGRSAVLLHTNVNGCIGIKRD
jgi:hypothetical protein